MITPENIVRHELIGLEVSVEKSSNKNLAGLKGEVIHETRQTLTIQAGKGEKKIPKDVCTFVFTLPDGKKVRVDGKILVSRPEDRIKKKFRKW